MPRNQRLVVILLLVVLLLTTAVPSMPVFAQDGDDGTCTGTGIFFWPCRLIDTLLNGVLNFFNWVLNTIAGFFVFLGDVIRWVFVAVGNIASLLWEVLQRVLAFVGSIVASVNEVFLIIGLIIQIIFGVISALSTWLWHSISLVGGLLTGFFAANPTPIPGAPQCITAPTQHDICAISYLLDNSIFGAPNGSIVVTIIIIIIDVSIVFLFVRKILNMLNVGEGVTDVA